MKRIVIFYFLLMTCHGFATTRQNLIGIAMSKLGIKDLEISDSNSVFSIVQSLDGTGFVIIDAQERIVAFSTDGHWEEDRMPPAVRSWLDKLKNNDVIDLSNSPREGMDWPSVLPLLTCHWHQNSPYNDLSPVIEDGNVKTAAGCVAIAAAQITYYWRKDNPTYTLKDTPTYIYGGAPVTESIPKETPNNWELLLDQYSTTDSQDSRYAAAQLCYVIGTTSYLNFASSTSGSIRDAANAMLIQFNLTSEYKPKSKLNLTEWETMLYSNLENGYPIMCSGVSSGGHAFVLDGYDSETGLYHFNFGWGGIGDGYYPVDNSEYSMGGYSMGQSVVCNIHPIYRNIEASLDCSISEGEQSVMNVMSTIKNNSTLPIRNLYLYAISDNSSLEEEKFAVWKGAGVNNDGAEYTISASVNIQPEKRFRLCLTDEHKYVLASSELKTNNSIDGITADALPKHYYNLFGQKVTKSHNGIYIIDYGTHKKKIIKRYD